MHKHIALHQRRHNAGYKDCGYMTKTNNQPRKISVIIPMFNTGSLINKCLEAILSQDYQGSYEVIVVDDGSTDDSLSRASAYERNSRLRILHKPNGGPASARNFGLDNISADSDWVTFIDSDDYVEPDFLSTLASMNADLRIASPFPTYGEWRNARHSPRDIMEFKDLFNNRQFCSYLKTGLLLPFWNKLFSLDIIRNNKLRVKEIRLLEDADFVCRYLQHCRSVEWINHKIYNYIKRPGSETSRLEISMVRNYIKLHEHLLQTFNPALSREIDEFVYPQYVGLIRKYIRRNDYKIAKELLREKLIKKAFASHKCGSISERIFKNLMTHGFVRTAKILYIR